MSEIERLAYKAFENVVQRAGDFTPREGQKAMARQVAKTLSEGTLGENDNPERSIAVIQAGTGVGKSLAASVPAIVAALERKTRVVISTATVALQEQLVNKDLPRFAQLMDQPFTFALAKGRGRYVCKLKLNRLAGGESDPNADLFDDEASDESTGTDGKGRQAPANVSESSIVLYKELAHDLVSGKWNGDRDTLKLSEGSLEWSPIAAERSTCTGKQCPQFRECTYYAARKELVGANVIVANHDLLLASVGAKLLPELNNCLLILDEGHELPSVASGQFSASMDLSSLRWLDQLAKRIQKVGAELRYDSTSEAVGLCRSVKQTMADLQGLVMGIYGSFVNTKEKTARLPHGEAPEVLMEPLRHLESVSMALAKNMKSLSDTLAEQIKESPESAKRLSTMYAALGALAPRLDGVVQTSSMMLAHEQEPDAKWFEFSDTSGYVRITAHASPLIPGKLLASRFWSEVRAAVVTSATITSCDSFDFFLREVGLDVDPAVTVLKVQSPFDFERQGKLTVVKTASSPKKIDDYNREMIGEFIVDLANVQAGALALFTSRSHLQQAYDSLPEQLKERVLLQGSTPKAALIREHKRRVDAGLPCTIMGLQSFGQGVDLPGRYCETVFIAKLPFAPPTDPISEARAEWLTRQRRDAFAELSVPAAGVRLNQWAGRLIRTEQDTGTVICYDKRLTDTGYGRRILAGMPAFRVSQRMGGEETALKIRATS